MSRLDQLALQSPCSADWAKMDGSDTRRFCIACEKAVHDLSAMAPCEAEALLARPGPAPCVRFLRRGDGTVVYNLARAAALAATSALAACGGHPYVTMGVLAEVPPAPTTIEPTTPVLPPAGPFIPEVTGEPDAIGALPPSHTELPPRPELEVPVTAYMGGLAPPVGVSAE